MVETSLHLPSESNQEPQALLSRSGNRRHGFLGLILFLVLGLLLSGNCSTEVTSTEEMQKESTVVPEASEAKVEVPTTPDAPDTPDAANAPDIPDTSSTPEAPDAADTPEIPETSDSPDTPAPVTPRLIALSKDGRIASLQLTTPWTVQASGDLKMPTASARCFGGRCLVVHPSPADSISVVNPLDLSKTTKLTLESGADPRDVALLDEKTVVVSQYGKASLLVIDLTTGKKESLDLSVMADADGIPETLRMAHCGKRVFVQLLRIDHKNGTPSTQGPGLAVIDFSLQGAARLIDADPNTPGVQAIKLTGSPNFDMHVDCVANQLLLAAPKPLMKGGGWYEQVDLKTLTASKSPINNGAQVGGFVVVAPNLYWFITHTATSPAGNSSHLNLVGGPVVGTYNTFADDKVDELALDPGQDLLFFPDNCEIKPTYPQCASGVHVFHARTGQALPKGVINLGFPPMELAISR